FGLVNPDVNDRREGELPALRRLGRELLRIAKNLFVACRRSDHDLHREEPPARKRRREEDRRTDPGDPHGLLAPLRLELERASFSFAPGLREHSAEAPARERELERLTELGDRLEDLVHLVGVGRHLLQARVGWYVERGEEAALILVRRELCRREHVQRD